MKRDFALAAESPRRVGMIIDRDNPPRLVHRFGYIMPERTTSLDADRFGSVLWDDGECDLVEWERLRPLCDMGHNPFKVRALGTAMFFAIKWHYDQGEKGDRRAVLRTGGKMAAVFVLALLGLCLIVIVLSRMLGLDLSFR